MNSLSVFLVVLFVFHDLTMFIFTNKTSYPYKIDNKVVFNFDFYHGELKTGRKVYGINFVAYGRDFEFRLIEQESVLYSATKVVIHKGNALQKMYLRNIGASPVMRGKLIHQNIWNVIGYVYEKELFLIFQEGPHLYMVEPPRLHVKDHQIQTGVIYRMRDVTIKPTYDDGKAVCEVMRDDGFLRFNYRRKSDRLQFSKQIPVTETLKSHQTMCSLEVLVDYTYFQHMSSDHKRVVTEVLYYIGIADDIFQKSDINEDRIPDGVGFNVEKITIFENKDDLGNPLSIETKDHNVFLDSLSRYRHPYCMLICFCHRDFWKRNDCVTGDAKKIGGICHNVNAATKKMSNVAFVTSLERNTTVPRFRVTLNLVHQLGHAFGCKDDAFKDKECSSNYWNPQMGNYIMYPKIPYGKKPNNWKFSPCCLRSMNRRLKDKNICLKKANLPSCGNGIVEEGEACDCDPSVDDCKEIEKCCILKSSSIKCSLQYHKMCSPGKGMCCDQSCSFVQSMANKSCYSNEICFNGTSVCDGLSPFCPGKVEPDGTSCFNNAGTCVKGECRGSICDNHGFKLCECATRHKECHICCKNGSDVCRTAKDHKLYRVDGSLFVKPAGTDCDNHYGTCLSNGTCVKKKFLTKVYGWKEIVIPPFAILIILACGYLYFVNKNKDNVTPIFRQRQKAKRKPEEKNTKSRRKRVKKKKVIVKKGASKEVKHSSDVE
ncbi:disintegrin and metalloproteinase domain-containing protein 10-like [Centruroides sculpturatus]|uniref:disintegrin and metalloproteinase domain-containing protein 10-like n=1 Tax=Centruroides sculpturatus TaxID=218467 RepID=UPI000C6E3D3C|nr:disintegrin and metalloproteinase domain-containing protein 10-like [Centruroides sculpturatus]